jgi:apolipoprotein N-acyltransferase
MANLLFPASMAALEWIQYTFTPFGSWGAASYTQMDHIVLLQSLSLFGMAGLSFLIYWVNMAIFSFIVDEHNRLKKINASCHRTIGSPGFWGIAL